MSSTPSSSESDDESLDSWAGVQYDGLPDVPPNEPPEEQPDENFVSKLRLSFVNGPFIGHPTGDYIRTSKKVRDKNIWITTCNARMMFFSGERWVVTSTTCMQDVMDGATGGYIASAGATIPYYADWGPTYEIKEVFLSNLSQWTSSIPENKELEESELVPLIPDANGISKLRLTYVQGDNYAHPNGDYTRTSEMVRDKNIWIYKSNFRMMFYSGERWVITSTDYMQVIKEGATGGFISSGCGDIPYQVDWGPDYKISEVYKDSQWCPYNRRWPRIDCSLM